MRTVNHYRSGSAARSPFAIAAVVIAVVSLLAQPVPAQGQPAAAPAAAPAEAAAEDAGAPAPAQPTGLAKNCTPTEVDATFRTKRNDIMRILRGGSVPPDQQALFEDYYKKYALARWGAPYQLAELEKKPEFNLPDCRRDLRNELKTAKAGAVHNQLAALALDYLSSMVKDPARYPASRCNAMLGVAELNAQEGARASDLPEPLPQALPVLLEAFKDANQIDAVRIAALLGIVRHAELGIANAQMRTTQVGPEMRKLAESKASPGRSVDGHVWMRARAIDTLGMLKDLGPNNAVVETLAAVLQDRSDDMLPRSAAARALGNLDYPGAQGLDASELATGLGQLAADACVAELARMVEEDKLKQRKSRRSTPSGRGAMGMGMGMGMEMGMMPGPGDPGGGMPGMPGMPGDDGMGGMPGMGPGGAYGTRRGEEEKEDETLNNRRRLKAYLEAVLTGFTSLKAKDRISTEGPFQGGVASLATAPPHSDFVTALLKQVDGVFDFCDTSDLEREDFRTQLGEQLALLRAELNKSPAAAANAPPAGAGQATETGPPAGDGQPANTTQPEGAGQPAAEGNP
ncbi:MAG: hypothetical protein ABIP48_32875 [Planctomycetota bacterium]